MSVETAIRIARALAESRAEDAELARDPVRLGSLLAHREELIRALKDACAGEAFARTSVEDRQRVASLLREVVAKIDVLRGALESSRQRVVMELAARAGSMEHGPGLVRDAHGWERFA